MGGPLGDLETKRLIVLLFAFLTIASGTMACAPSPEVKEAIRALGDGNWEVRRDAALELGRIGPERGVIPALIQALGDDEWKVREAASDALGRIGPEAVPALIQALEDEDWRVREAAAWALRVIRPRAVGAAPALLQVLEDDENADVREAAAEALGETGLEKEVIPALIQALEDEERVHKAATDALVHIGPEAVPALLQVLEDDENADVREAAASGVSGRRRRKPSLPSPRPCKMRTPMCATPLRGR
jgi:HEAT repeat protein